MLNIIGGLDQYDSGDLLIEGVSTKEYKDSNWDSYRNNRIGFVFQNFNLIHHQTVLSNVELALTLSGISPKERKDRAKEALKNVGLIEHIHKLPNQMSGGQIQRIAIARALVNDPEIILADEPTGSLDSITSKQVMDLLKEVGKDRLVIMVTHNSRLAYEYSDRIIQLKDGKIIKDSNSYIPLKEEKTISKKESKKSKMSFLTAIGLSISNLMTKKGRTLITAIAGSIGIIGIAAILALAGGINLYIEGIERNTVSAYPLTIDSSGIDITSFLEGGENNPIERQRKKKKEDEINVIDTFTSLFAQQNENDLKSFKKYIENNEKDIKPYVKNIQYKYGINPQIYLKNEEAGVRQVNPDAVFSGSGFDRAGGFEMISGAGNFGMKNFSELPGETSLIKKQYDIVKGRWPKEKNELIVVLTARGSLTDRTMYALGIKDRNNLKRIFENFTSGEKVKIDDKEITIFYDDVLDITFKLINSAKKYVYDKSHNIWLDKSEDVSYMDEVIEEGLDLNIVGIIKAKEEIKTPMLSTGIYYPDQLIHHLIEEASSYDIVKEQLANEDINIFTNRNFDDEEELEAEELFQLEDFISIDQSAIQRSFNIDTSAIDLEISDFDINIDSLDLPDLNFEILAREIGGQINIPEEEIQEILLSLLRDFVNSQKEKIVIKLQEWVDNFRGYIGSEEVQNRLIRDFEEINNNNQISQKISKIVKNYFTSYMLTSFNQIMETVQENISRQIQSKMPDLATNMQKAISIDTGMLAQAFQFNLNEKDLLNFISSLEERDRANQGSNLRKLGYRDLDDPSQIDFYPNDFTTKENVVKFIDKYNEKMHVTNQEDKIIKYSDLISALLSSVTTIIDTISFALIAFVAISLVVSSIMIGVITYVSVLERIKEIGILRAIGASKKDIRRVFNAETLIIGFIAGLIGILTTYVLSYYANILIYNRFSISNISHLELRAAAALILMSMVLAIISGLIPSSAAANKDPVEALRSE